MAGMSRNPELFKGKVNRQLKFRVAQSAKGRINGIVHDLGIKNNLDRKEMLRLAIKPDEIAKVRKAKILEEQRAVGFRSDLLFDDEDLPEYDRNVLKDLDEPPTVEEMFAQLGVNIDLSE